MNSSLGQAQLSGDLPEAVTSFTEPDQLGVISLNSWSSANSPLLASPSKSGYRTLRQSHSFLLGNDCQNRNHGIFENSAGVQIHLSEAAVSHTVGSEPLEILKGFENSLPRKAVKAPKQNKLEFSP